MTPRFIISAVGGAADPAGDQQRLINSIRAHMGVEDGGPEPCTRAEVLGVETRV